MPPKVSAKDLRQDILTRRDFNNQIRSLDRFTRKGASDLIRTPGGAVTTKWQVREIQIQNRANNLRMKRQQEKLKAQTVKIPGTDMTKTGEQMGAAYLKDYDQRKINLERLDQAAFDKVARSVQKTYRDSYLLKKDARYKENYIQGIYATLGGAYGSQLADLLKQIPANVIVEAYHENPELLGIPVLYDPIEEHIKFDRLFNEWQEIAHNVGRE